MTDPAAAHPDDRARLGLPEPLGDQPSDPTALPFLFRPITLRGVTVRNRIVVSPMCQYLSVEGGPTDWHLVHLGRFAMGGAGIVFSEDSVVEERGRTTHRCAGLYDDRLIPGYRRITSFIKAMGAVPAAQIGHTGRVASTKGPLEGFGVLTQEDEARGLRPWQPVAASEGHARADGIVPLVLDAAGIRDLVAEFAAASRRAAEAGYEICEIHGGHGYLIHQFLSAGSNGRRDAYGGDLEGRMRFAFEVVEAVRAVWPADKPLFFRISCVEGKGGSWGLPETLVFARGLLERGVDVIDCSSGGIGGDSELPAVPRVPGFQVPYAARIKGELGCTTMAVGGIRTGRQAERILESAAADLVAVATEMMLDPSWAVRCARELGVEPYFLLPTHHAVRVRRRDDQFRASPPGSPVEIPLGIGQSESYRWDV